MDFAKKQLEKYGWKSGKGLGKEENGITEAIKPKLKRSVAGIGHDAAAEFTEHWWKTLYDKASQNVEIHEENGVPKRFKAKEDFEITNSTWKLGRKNKSQRGQNPEYFDNFIKKAVLTSGGTKLENMSSDSDNDEDLKEKKDVFNMTDEELFAACGGRTAHKGARHGLRATGKLARIEHQEQSLLIDPKFAAYSKKTPKLINKTPQMEELSLNSDSEKKTSKKKKKKYCTKSNDNADLSNDFDIDSEHSKKSNKSKKSEIDTDSKMEVRTEISDPDNQETGSVKSALKKKKRHCKNDINTDSYFDSKELGLRAKSSDINTNNHQIETVVTKKKKKHCKNDIETDSYCDSKDLGLKGKSSDRNTDNQEVETAVSKKKKKHCKEKKDNSFKTDEITNEMETTELAVITKKKRKNNVFNNTLNDCDNDGLKETTKSKKKQRQSNLNEDLNDL